MKAAVAACERSGEAACGERVVPGEPRDRFSRHEDERVHVFVLLADVEPLRSYAIQVRWFGPAGGVAGGMTKRVLTPGLILPGYRVTTVYWIQAKTMSLGRWRAEIAVNGEVEAERTFEIVDSGT